MTGRQWRRVALGFYIWHLISWGVPFTLDHLGNFWGPLLTVPILAALGIGAILVPLREPSKTEATKR